LIYRCSLIEGKRNDDDSASVRPCDFCLLNQIRPEPKSMLRQVLCLCPILLVVADAAFTAAADPPREQISINDNWRFTRDDPTNCPRQPKLTATRRPTA
jgi:hypothetical protein